MKWNRLYKVMLVSGLLAASTAYADYNSGSTGADGPFNPTESQAIQLPADGIFNYSSVNIPAGVTITYIKNAANTPVTILSSTDVIIEGTIDVSATATDVTGAGKGGPGGFDGGASGVGSARSTWSNGYGSPNVGRAGIGPGGGQPAAPKYPGSLYRTDYFDLAPGGGGAYGTAPNASGGNCPVTPGSSYGNETLVPLIGGSGGGGGIGGTTLSGTGGGGGGGAILIAASGTIDVQGAILANGGTPAANTTLDEGRGTTGGGGSGGAIRLIATTVTGGGTISAAGGNPTQVARAETVNSIRSYYCSDSQSNRSNIGGAGRIRIDAETLNRTVATTPPWSRGAPSLAFVPGLPSLTITSIGGVAVPSGNSTIDLAAGFTNPVTINFTTTGVTVGSSVEVTVSPAKGQTYSAVSQPTTGTTESATGSVSVELLPGTNTIQASVTYTVVASVGDALSNFAKGERVESVTVASVLGGSSMVTLTTVTGKKHVVPASVLTTAKISS